MGHAGISRGRIEQDLVGFAGLDRLLHRVIDPENDELRTKIPELLYVLSFQDGESLEDVIDVISREVVEVAERGIEFTA